MSRAAYLLDTHALLWWMIAAKQLGTRARKIIANTDNLILVSAATLREIAIKHRRKRLTGCQPYLEDYASWHKRWGFVTLDIKAEHAVHAGLLAFEHADPFDRMLIAQSEIRQAPLLTCDRSIQSAYSNCVW